MDDKILTPEGAAKLLSLTVYTVRQYARQGILPATKIGRTWRFSHNQLMEWLTSGGYPAARRTVDYPMVGETMTLPKQLEQPAQTYTSDRRMSIAEAVSELRSIRARSVPGDNMELIRESRREAEERERRGETQ